MKVKPVISFLLMIVGVTGLGFIAPWWAATIWIIFVAAIMKLNKTQGMLTGTLAVGLVWILMSLFMNRHDTAQILTKTGELLGGLSNNLMLLVTFIIALITGFLSGWLGSAIGLTVRPEKTTESVRSSNSPTP